jgi:hypothetical protein
VEESEGEGGRWAALTPKTHVDGGWWGGQNVEMFPSGSRHDGEVQENATDSMVAANGVQGTLVGPVPNHDGAQVEVHDVPMACHGHPGVSAREDKETAVHLVRQGQLVDELRGDMSGNQVQGNGRVVGAEAKRMWTVRAWDG